MIKRKPISQKKQYSKSYAKRRNRPSISFLLGVILLLCVAFIYFLQADNRVHVEREITAPSLTHRQFIDELAPKAKLIHQEYGLLPSISLAQAILESDWGQSELSTKYYNLFGVKAGDNEPKILLSTAEYEDGQWKQVKANFKIYPNWNASLEDHVKLFVQGVSWNPDLYHDVLNAKDYVEGAYALQESGYATDPTYASKLIEIIEENDLQKYDSVHVDPNTDIK